MSAAAKRMSAMSSFDHTPVLLPAVLELCRRAAPDAAGVRWVVDGTVGGGGHAAAILDAFPDARLIGLDRDATAVVAASERLQRFDGRALVVHARFGEVEAVMRDVGVAGASVMLVDLGVSSVQLDRAERGFSFQHDGPLDMRMDPSADAPLSDVLADIDEDALTSAIRELGEERHARRVARRVLEDRPESTAELAAIVRAVVPKSKDGLDPATRTFQALRILVNGELEQLAAWLAVLPAPLVLGGVAMAVSFHSLEDRAVKQRFRDLSSARAPDAPFAAGRIEASCELLTKKPVSADADEVRRNVRARSAKLRAIRRLR